VTGTDDPSPTASNGNDASLVGTWLLDSVVQFYPDPGGTRATPRKRAGTGSLIYAPDGWMSVLMILAPGRGPTRTEATAGARGPVQYGYFGRYKVDWAQRRVRHEIHRSFWPPENGTTLVRRFELKDGRLTLDADFTFDGERRLNRLVWRRAESSDGLSGRGKRGTE
jgi:hypothetical protein